MARPTATTCPPSDEWPRPLLRIHLDPATICAHFWALTEERDKGNIANDDPRIIRAGLLMNILLEAEGAAKRGGAFVVQGPR